MFDWQHQGTSVSDQMAEILHEVASDMNKLKRELVLTLPLLAEITVIAWQVTSCSKISAIGSLLLIHGRITILPGHRITQGRGSGSLMATRSQNGDRRRRVPFFGSMENVGCLPALMDSWTLIVISFRSGRRKECTLVRLPSEITVFEPKVSASSTIIEEIKAMQKSGLALLAMFYYDFREDQKKDRRGLLSSVLVQLCRQSDSYYDVLSKFYLEHENGFQHASDDALARCLKDIVRLPGQAPIFLIVDALDECPNTSSLSSPRDNVLILVEDLVNSQLTNLRICVTSRPEADIKIVLETLTFRSVSLHDESGQKEDIENYIKWVVNTHRKMRRWKAEQRQLVIDMLTERADGM